MKATKAIHDRRWPKKATKRRRLKREKRKAVIFLVFKRQSGDTQKSEWTCRHWVLQLSFYYWIKGLNLKTDDVNGTAAWLNSNTGSDARFSNNWEYDGLKCEMRCGAMQTGSHSTTTELHEHKHLPVKLKNSKNTAVLGFFFSLQQ